MNPETIQAIANFLGRCQIRGTEAEVYTQCMQALGEEFNKSEQPDLELKEEPES
jgi:hypothetical protein